MCRERLSDIQLDMSGRQYVCDEVLPFTCNELCQMKMELLDDVCLDEMSRVICALLNTCQTGINRLSPVSDSVIESDYLLLSLLRLLLSEFESQKICVLLVLVFCR